MAPGLSPAIQYWTTRGYSYVCVSHASSTSSGRAYRMLLQGEWGVIDIADAASCVSYLISQQLINGSCVGIIGESAGGFAVLQALCVYPDLWAGAVSLYGVVTSRRLSKQCTSLKATTSSSLPSKMDLQWMRWRPSTKAEVHTIL